MPVPFAWPTLALAGGLLVALQGEGKWKPHYDYTNLQPTDEEYWAPIEKAAVSFREALALVRSSAKAPVRILRGELRPGDDGALLWYFQVFEGGPEAMPKRVNLQVSTEAPELLGRLELNALLPEDERAWQQMLTSKVEEDDALEAAFRGVWGDKDTPMMADPHVRYMRFTTTVHQPSWDLELLGLDRSGTLRRYAISVATLRAVCRTVLLQDRFAGEPLRIAKPITLENGLLIHDFMVGDGPAVTPSSMVTIHYRSFLLDNTKVFDTFKVKRSEIYQAGKIPMKGMAEGVIGMRAGGRRKIVIPYDKAFGEEGNSLAPPRAMITCDVTILEVGVD